MGLSGWLARAASGRLHVLLAETTGGFWVRLVAERACVRRGWPLAMSPAEADVLLVCGSAESDLEREALDAVWAQLPGPRVRVVAGTADQVAAALDDVADQYRDPLGQRHDRHARAATDAPSGDQEGIDQEGMDQEGIDQEGMDHEGMDMSGPGGIPLASGGPDRDGLELDVLHLRLGPLLPAWPPELVVWCSLHGDLVVDVEVDVLSASPASVPARVSGGSALRRIDRAVGLLRLAGASASAASLALVLDRLLAGAPAREVVGTVRQVRRRTAHSYIMRWSLRGSGVVSQDVQRQHGLPSSVVGDVWDRLLWLLDRAGDELDSAAADPSAGDDQTVGEEMGALAAALPDVLRGRDLAEGRLLVASLLGHGSGAIAADGASLQESPHG